MNRLQRSQSLKTARPCHNRPASVKRALAALCLVAALGITSTPAHADELQAVICTDEAAAHAQARDYYEDSDAGSLTEKLAERLRMEAFDTLFACVARQEGLCGHVGQMYQDESASPELSRSERDELVIMVMNCVYLGNPDG